VPAGSNTTVREAWQPSWLCMMTIRLDWRDLNFERFDLKDFLLFPF
jgi:hypothetical protein